jgi:peptidoglycan/LPS O-acetylase OafA/YrhL
MEFDLAKTAVAFVALIALGVGALLAAPVMAAGTVLTMVLPAMVVFGLLCLVLGVRHGEFRTAGR